MNRKYTFPLLFLLILTGLISYKFSFSFFSDSSDSQTNVFAAASTFPSVVADHLVISEIQINGGNANEDFVEIYNPTDSSVDLENWEIRTRASNGTESTLITIGAGKTIAAHGFFLWSNDQGNFETQVGADVSSSENIAPNNSVALLNASDTIIDRVAWGNSTTPFVEGTAIDNSLVTNQSMERKANSSSTQASMTSGADVSKGNGFDSDNNTNDFIFRVTSGPQNTTSGTETP
jgi:hypothetical protein